MKHRNRNTLAALLAAGLLVLSAAGSTALAHGPGGWGGPGFGNHDPGKAHSSGAPTQKAKPSNDIKVPGPTWHLPTAGDCAKVPTPSSSPTPSASTGATADKATSNGKGGGFGLAMSKIADSWGRVLDATVKAQLCSVQGIQTSGDKKIASLIKSLQALDVRVGKITGLTSSDQTMLTGEIDGLVGDLNALKTKLDAETTLAGAQADLVTLSGDGKYARSIGSQVRLIDFAENAIGQGTKLSAVSTTLAGQIAAAPSGIDTAGAQTYLTDMNSKVAAAETLAGPVPALLLALTPAQVQAGKSDPTLAKAGMDLWQASFDLWKARQDGRIVTWILAGKPDSDGHKDKSPSPSITPVPSPTAAPTAIPV
jgi:hypothetical protein